MPAQSSHRPNSRIPPGGRTGYLNGDAATRDLPAEPGPLVPSVAQYDLLVRQECVRSRSGNGTGVCRVSPRRRNVARSR
jgi:hypothetical protein